MDEFKDTDLVCVTRYCPNCGSEVFCRTDYDKHRVFYMSEDMTDPTNTCPRCQFNLLLLPVEAIMAMPGPGKEVLPRKPTAGKTLIESLHARNREIFPTKASAKRALNALGRVIFDALARGERCAGQVWAASRSGKESHEQGAIRKQVRSFRSLPEGWLGFHLLRRLRNGLTASQQFASAFTAAGN